jgi:hypothetical protein
MKRYLYIGLLFAFFFLPSIVHAAFFHFSYEDTAIKDSETAIALSIDTERTKINAVSGKIAIPKDLSIERMITGSSSVLFWIEMPRVTDGFIEFSGITPGGFSGDREVFSFVMVPKSYESIDLTVSDGAVFKDDESGEPLSTRSKKAYIRVVSGDKKLVPLDDSIPPEPFDVVVSSDQNIFDGEPFLVFAAQDKGSGIVRYEWAHTRAFYPNDSDWNVGNSPVRLGFGALFSRIFIRAFDVNSNMRVVEIAGPYRYAFIAFGCIIVASVLCVLYLYARRSFSRRSS